MTLTGIRKIRLILLLMLGLAFLIFGSILISVFDEKNIKPQENSSEQEFNIEDLPKNQPKTLDIDDMNINPSINPKEGKPVSENKDKLSEISKESQEAYERETNRNVKGANTDEVLVQKIFVVIWDSRQFFPNSGYPVAGDPEELSYDLKELMETASIEKRYLDSSNTRRNVEYQIIDVVKYSGITPKIPGTPPITSPDGSAISGSFDYNALVDMHNFCQKLNNNEIDEVWVWADRTGGFKESLMMGPSNQIFYINGEPIVRSDCNRAMYVMGFNYEVWVDQAMHSYGHRAEDTLAFFLDGVQKHSTYPGKTSFEYLGLNYDSSYTDNHSYIGTIHWPHNAIKLNDATEYDYDNNTNKSTDFKDWNPQHTGEKSSLNCSQWGCTTHGYYMQWFQNLPGKCTSSELRQLNGKPMINMWRAILKNSFYVESDGCETVPTSTPSATQPPSPIGPPDNEDCQPMLEYCDPPGANLLDDVFFNQSNDGSFENPICTLKPDGSYDGKGCDAVNQQHTYYQADRSALLPINSMAFFTSGAGYDKPEYIVQEVAGAQQCEEVLTAHGNNSYKIFSRQGLALKGGLCLPMKPHGNPTHSGINFRVSQATKNISDNVEVTFRLGYITSPVANNFYFDSTPSLQQSSITWVSSRTIGQSEYGKEEGYAARYAGGFLETTLPGNATGFCFMAESVGGQGINTFWDAAFASIDPNSCDIATEHKDGIDRSCGGYACGNVDPTLSGNGYVDFNQEYYAFDMPPHWRATQCHYETETNGAESPFGTLYAGLDLNNCDPNYFDPAQRNLHPEMDKADVACADSRNWIYGYAWAGGVKDFGLLQYLDCALSSLDGNEIDKDEKNAFKGTKSNPYFCDQILKSYANSIDIAIDVDPAFNIRYSNTYSGLVNAVQAESDSNFWKVPLLGSAVASSIINNRHPEANNIDPFLISKRNSGAGLNNFYKFNLEDEAIARIVKDEDHNYIDSIIPQNEILMKNLLAGGPVCEDIVGDPITKIHYGPADGESDRAIFGFADDAGSFEHLIHAENNDITTRQLCDFQLLSNRVEGADCTIGSIKFTEGNIGQTLEGAGVMNRITVPTLPPPSEPGIPLDPNFDDCPEEIICGQSFGCGSSMTELYNVCKMTIDEFSIGISGNPFIRQELPNGWKDLEVFGLNKVMESLWHNEITQYNYPIRHENVGIDINQVVSMYDQQQPRCSIMPDSRKPVYCSDNEANGSALDKAQEVCRRVPPYNCNCGPSNFTTCLLNCKAQFKPPPPLEDVGLPIEGTILPTLPPGPDVTQPSDTAIRPILDNTHESFLERFVKLLDPKTYPGEGGNDYEEGQVYSYDPRYTGGFLLANTGGEATQCTTQVGPRAGESVSQVRIENYYAYAGQLARMNERVGFAATNNEDPDTVRGIEVDLEATANAIRAGSTEISQLQELIASGGDGYDFIALPYCDMLSDEEKFNCSTSTEVTCDCMIRSCEQEYTDKGEMAAKHIPKLCELIKQQDIDSGACVGDPQGCASYWLFRGAGGCVGALNSGYKIKRDRDYEKCIVEPKTNLNFNCDPMANYLIEQGFDTAELRLAACDDILNDQQCDYEKFGVHLITGPIQQENYTRADTLGLGWKMEVIVDDSPEMVNAMADSVNSFSGKTVFRFCNADQGEAGSKIQDQSCKFRTEITGSPAESGRKTANMILQVAEKTTKAFLVSPINEPVSEHWFGGDLNDDSNPTTMADASEFYTAFAEVLNANQTLRNKIEIGGPTYNVTAFGSYANFEKFHSEFSAKALVDYWTINIYNHDDLPPAINKIEIQFEHVKSVFNDAKPIGINETGDFQHNILRLRDSFAIIGPDPRLKYALLFNAFGGWGDMRGAPLILTDVEIKNVLSDNGVCKDIKDPICYEDPNGGGNLVANPLPFAHNFTQVYDQLLAPSSPGGRSCSDMPPAAGDYYEPNDVGMICQGYETRKALPEYEFYRGALRRCGIPIPQTRWTEENTYNSGGDLNKVKTAILAKNITYMGRSLNEADESKLEQLLLRAKAENRNPMVLISIWATESIFGLYGNKNEFNCFSDPRPTDFNSSLECVLRIPYMVDRSTDEFIDRYGPYCDNETHATGEGDGGGEIICPDDDGTTPGCLVAPINTGYTVTQCFGTTNAKDATNANCFAAFPYVELLNTLYGKDEVPFHSGLDIGGATPELRKVFSSGKGVVRSAGFDSEWGFGNYVIVEHTMSNSGTVYYTSYAHLDSISVTNNQTVDHNTQIGVMGNTGNSDGIHLHFQVMKYDKKIEGDVKKILGYVGSRPELVDPTDIMLRDRSLADENCSIPEEEPEDEITAEGITRFNLGGMIVLKIDKDEYTPALEWDANGKILSSWASANNAQVIINGSIFEGTSPLTSSGRLKIRGNIIQSTTSGGFNATSGQGYLGFSSNDFSIDSSHNFSFNSDSNILESLPVLILDGRKYTSNTRVSRKNTSVGYDAEGNFIVVIVPTEQTHSYSRIADLMLSSGLGVKSLLNLDGGGSTGLIIKTPGLEMNSSSSLRAIPGIVTFKKN